MPLDLATRLPDLEADAPAGPNLEFDAAFGELERTAAGTPERQSGEKIIPAVDPVWKDVAAQAADLLERTYDLRVLAHLATARLNVSGLGEYVAVLATIANLLDERWDHVHPQLDPEDDNDPAVRANALLPLASRTRVLRALRALPIAGSRRAGVVTWQTIAVANGETDAVEGSEGRSEAEIRAAFNETPRATIEALRGHAAAGIAAVDAITAAFDSHSGYGNQPDLKPLTKMLKDLCRYIDLYAVPESPDAAVAEAPDDAVASGDDSGAVAPSAATISAGRRSAGASAMTVTAIATRAEALHLLDVVARYFQQNEPSSPLPLMLLRARGLADKSFLEILQDLAPDGFSQAQMIVQSRDG